MRWLRRRLRHVPCTLASLPAYDLWAQNYPPRAHNPLMVVEQQAMLALMPSVQGRIVLDLACGSGRYGQIAGERGAKQVIGLDNSPAMLQAGKLGQVALARTDAIPLSSSYVDIVLCGLALGHVPQLEPSLREVGRVLKPDGVALISDFHPFQFLSGARRTFRAPDGRVYRVEHYPHLYSHYHRAGQVAGLSITAVAEPALEGAKPVVLVLRYEKEGG